MVQPNGLQTPRSLSDEGSSNDIDDEGDMKPDVDADDKKRRRE
jgi:hypothetical protein